ncbi:MAG: hypothetical protein CMH57_07695 [Myxococcales bacterium]|nr:hypothetical protein [Myxococcales bacterium]
MASFRYTPYYCEENAWHLCQHERLRGLERRVVFVSNALRCCPLWFQRASPDLTEPVLWDYHVLVIAREQATWQVWDLDTRLPCPLALPSYVEATFGPPHVIPDEFHPRFRVVAPKPFIATFSSDRSHMLDEDGAWREPPPPWPPLFAEARGMNLMRFVDMEDDFIGEVMDRGGLLERFGG